MGVRDIQTILLARRLLAVIQPCTGDRASGPVKLFARSGTVVRVPRGCYALPILSTRATPSLLFKTAEGPEEDESWLVADSGTDVTFISNVGGKRHNLPIGTQILLDPRLPALVSSPLPVTAAPFTGGADLLAFGAINDAVIYETMQGPSIELDLQRSDIGRFPALVVTWIETQPADGTTIPRVGPRANRLGTRKSLYTYDYQISIISERGDTDHARRHEGLAMADTVADFVIDRKAVDGECLSSPSGVQVRNIFREIGPQEVYKKFYVYSILVSAMGVRQMIDERVFSEWLLAVLAADKPDAALGPIRVVDDNEIDMS